MVLPAAMTTVHACAECGKEEGGTIMLKTCKSCMIVKYCNANCQRNHWPKHKKECKERAAELHDEALFKDPPAKEDCSICFLPMPVSVFASTSLPPATISSVPIYDFTSANVGLPDKGMEAYYPCCGQIICVGCIHSFFESGNAKNCPYCRARRTGKTNEEKIEELMKRVEVNDAGAMTALGSVYYEGLVGLSQDQEKAKELWTQAARLGSRQAHFYLGNSYREGGEMKMARLHYEAAAMAGHEVARFTLGQMEYMSGNVERAHKHWTIAASAGDYTAMDALIILLEKGYVSRDAIVPTLTAYNYACVEMQSEARDAYIRTKTDYII